MRWFFLPWATCYRVNQCCQALLSVLRFAMPKAQDTRKPAKAQAATLDDAALLRIAAQDIHVCGTNVEISAAAMRALSAATILGPDDRSELGELRAELAKWKLALTTNVSQCATCDGNGIMDVVVGYRHETEQEVTDVDVCAECTGTGRGDIALAIEEARKQGEARSLARLMRAEEALAACELARNRRDGYTDD